MPKSKLYLIDGHALCYRCYYAIRGLMTSKGQATNAVYGFISTLRKILRDHGPDYLAVCFDVGKKTHRQEKFAEYKIQRPSMPDDLITQIPIIKDVVEAFNVPVFEQEGFEADDIIATIAQKNHSKDLEIVIVSDDKDMLQLVNDNIKVMSVRKDEILGHNEAKKKLGIDPAHIVDLIGLAGDKVDNIPGVAGVGAVTARNLINEFGDLETIFKNLDKIKSAKVKEKLQEQKEMAFFSKELSILDANVPIKYKLTDLKVDEPDKEKLAVLFRDLEFKRLAEEFSDGAKDVDVSIKSIQSKDDCLKLIKDIEKKEHFSFLLNPQSSEELGSMENFFVAVSSEHAYAISSDLIKEFKTVFENKKVIKVTHNIKDSMKALVPYGIGVKGRVFDVMLAGYLLMPSHNAYDVEALTWAYLKSSVSQVNRLAQEVLFVEKLFPVLLKELEDRSLLKLFEEVEVPLAYVLFRMESTGLKLDTDFLKQMSKECDVKIAGLTDKLYNLAQGEFNLNSPKQLSHVLFEKLKLPVIKKTKTGFSTDESVLTRLAETHELPALILEYRQLAKLKSTYIDALPKLISPLTGRLHATFNQTGTETGRLSSNNPNLQNIPIRTELGRQIRKAFVASDSTNVIIAADYSQVELRILAHLSKDKSLIKAFKDDQDIHQYTASLIFDVDEKKVTKDMRNSAKRVNFGIIYGMSAFGLAKDLKITQNEAQEFINRYFLRYPDVKKFMDGQVKLCEEKGYVVTLLSRRRYIPEINNQNINVKQFAERQAINTPVQGSAADLMKLAMINIQGEIEKRKLQSKMISTVHDELVFDVPKKEEAEMVLLIRELMEHPMKLAVPVTATIKTGKNWLDMKEVK